MQISFTGRSDDLIHVNYRPDLGDKAYEHIEEFSHWEPSLTIVKFKVASSKKSMLVAAIHGLNECWAFAPFQNGEGNDMFRCLITKGHDYSSKLVITCPPNTRVTKL